MEKLIKFCRKAVDKFGKNTQSLKVIEELLELQTVLIWDIGSKEKNRLFIREKVIEEMSDILMTFESLKIIYDISDQELRDQISWKIDKKEKELFKVDSKLKE